jgi:DNA-binding response OmpR family regulator
VAKILVVDDHPNIVRLLQRLLAREAHEVLTAADGIEALEKIRQERPDLVVLDVMMPRMNGFEVLYEVKSDPALKETIVIMLTAQDQAAEMSQGLQLGADWYLPKPFSPADVSSVIRRFLAAAPP